jgi:hypothetical protein
MTEKKASNPLERKMLHKERATTGTHTFFIEVRVAKSGSKYLVIDQRQKVGDTYESVKMRIFEDEMLEFQRILQKVIRLALGDEALGSMDADKADHAQVNLESELYPPFFDKLLVTGDWKEFERYTDYLLKLLGIQAIYTFVDERQAGKADGFFKFGNLAVMYDCTLDVGNIEENKKDQIINYCNRLRQGNLELQGGTTLEFHNHHKQVWLITRGASRRIKLINDIVIKEVAVRDIANLYQERLKGTVSDEHLEASLRNI